MDNKPTVVSLFSGCGGKDLGFLLAGFSILWANDTDEAACRTYRTNIGPIECGDIATIPSDDIPNSDLVIGGFPCQGFSMVGPRRLDDSRNLLYREMRRVVRDKQPKVFVAENVRGLTSMAGGMVLATMLDDFRELGYNVSWRLLNAVDFGLPQRRERVFIVGNRLDKENHFPEPCGARSTLRDAIGRIGSLGGLPDHEVDNLWRARNPEWAKIMSRINEGQKLCNVRLGPRSLHTWNVPEVFGRTTAEEKEILLTIAKNRRHKIYGGGDANPLPGSEISRLAGRDASEEIASLVAKGYLVQKRGAWDLKNAFNGTFRRMTWDEPCDAVLTVFRSPRYYVHPSEDRALSVRECARVQGFPDSFLFNGTIAEKYTQVGNAVPPPLAQAVAESIRPVLRLPAHPAAPQNGDVITDTLGDQIANR